MTPITCPYCFQVHDLRHRRACPETNQEIPDPFVEACRTDPPLWLMTLGYQEHGKTSFVLGLLRALESLQLSSTGYLAALDDPTARRIAAFRHRVKEGRPPEPTPADRLPRPLLFHVHGLPGIRSRCLVLYDLPGQDLDDPRRLDRYGGVLPRIRNLWFVVNREDLEERGEGRGMQQLFSRYSGAMNRVQAPLEGRRLIVVYTKGDRDELSPRLRDHLARDPLARTSPGSDEEAPGTEYDSHDYRQQLREISDALRDLTRQIPDGAGFINMVEDKGMELCFTITSALGRQPEGRDHLLPPDSRPRRVLDPYLWATEHPEPVSSAGLHLVLDGKLEAAGLLPRLDLPRLAARLGELGGVTISFLGRSTPTALPGQPPPSPPWNSTRPRLLGPPLEHCGPEERVVVLSTGPVLDLGDLAQAPWRDRCVLMDCSGAATAPAGGPSGSRLEEWDRLDLDGEHDPVLDIVAHTRRLA